MMRPWDRARRRCEAECATVGSVAHSLRGESATVGSVVRSLRGDAAAASRDYGRRYSSPTELSWLKVGKPAGMPAADWWH